MIEIMLYREDTEIMGFEISGHAESDEYGRDIVCASVSVLAQTAVNALGELTGIDFEYEVAEGYLRCLVPKKLPSDEKQKVATIMKTIYVGYESVAESYPDYVNIRVRRCDDYDD
ncbi:MAG TPA: ribosomal-processing cysteine protease Prp [Clostridia bacterium]|nr:ribosomal-processing cysteine protease Prp [Clostridia bacterium]